MSKIGENIKKTRIKLGISQYRLSKLSGVAQPTISAIEAEDQTRSPATDTVERIAKALHVPLSVLMGDDSSSSNLSDPSEIKLIQIYHQLNDRGKSLLIQQAEFFLQQPDYRQETSISSIV